MRPHHHPTYVPSKGLGFTRCPATTCASLREPSRRRASFRGLTLIELIVVLVVLVALGAIIVPMFGNAGEDAREQSTRATMSRVAEAIVGPGGYAEVMSYARDPGGSGTDDRIGEGSGLPWPSDTDQINDGRADHPQLSFLFTAPAGLPDYDPATRIGWRGPWLSTVTATPYEVTGTFTAVYGLGDGRDGLPDDDLAPIDGWGNPIVIQLPDVSASVITDEEIEHVRLVSAGPDGVINTPDNVLAPTDVGDDLVLFLRRENP